VYVVGYNDGDSENETLYALNRSDGSTSWTKKWTDGITTSPVVVDDLVIIGTKTEILGIENHIGLKKWDVLEIAEDKSDPAVVDETVFIGADDLIALAPESDIIPEGDTSSTNPDTDSDTTNPNQTDAFNDSERLYLTGGVGVAGAALSAYWWITRSKTKTVLECPNCSTQTNTKIHSIGEVCTECNNGYLSEDGTEIDVTDD
jgi:outer membrane protein assembly factor BamB